MRTLAFLLALAAAPLAPAAPTPRPSPPFVFNDARNPKGPKISLSQFRGRIIALALTQTTCSHCQFLTHTLNKIQADYAARNVMVLECAFNPDVVMTLPPFMHDVHPDFPMGYTTEAEVMKYLGRNEKRDGPIYVPYMLFIDEKGVIRYDESGRNAKNTDTSGFFEESDKNVRAILDKMLAIPAAPKKN
jgi:hypothetical protein